MILCSVLSKKSRSDVRQYAASFGRHEQEIGNQVDPQSKKIRLAVSNAKSKCYETQSEQETR